MKKGLFAIAASLFLLASCNETKDSTAGNESMHKKNAEAHETVLKAIESGDVSKLDSILAKDVVDHEGNMGKDIVGLDSVKAFLSSMHNYFDGLKWEVLHSATSPDGQYFYATVRMRGKAKANPWGMPEGMDMDDTSVDLVKMKDGKCTDHWGFSSMKDVMEMMQGNNAGGNPPPPEMKKD